MGTGWLLSAFCTLLTVVHAQIKQCDQPTSDHTNIYDFSMLDITRANNVSLSDYRGKVVLVVNVATY